MKSLIFLTFVFFVASASASDFTYPLNLKNLDYANKSQILSDQLRIDIEFAYSTLAVYSVKAVDVTKHICPDSIHSEICNQAGPANRIWKSKAEILVGSLRYTLTNLSTRKVYQFFPLPIFANFYSKNSSVGTKANFISRLDYNFGSIVLPKLDRALTLSEGQFVTLRAEPAKLKGTTLVRSPELTIEGHEIVSSLDYLKKTLLTTLNEAQDLKFKTSLLNDTLSPLAECKEANPKCGSAHRK